MSAGAPVLADAPGRGWGTIAAIVTLVVTGKGLAFIREAVVASELGTSASSDGYYLALAMPTAVYSLGALPFSMWVTARLAALRGTGALAQAASFHRQVLLLVCGLGVVVSVIFAAAANLLVPLYAPGLDGPRLHQAVELTRIGALAVPALGLQAVCNGRLFADGRFVLVYVWLLIGSLVGLTVVASFASRFGAQAAVWGFVAAAWSSIVGPVILNQPRKSVGGPGSGVTWVDDLNVSVVYRALVMQLYFQGSLLLVYAFGSTLPEGGLSAALFGSKIQTAVYETLGVTAGVLVYPRIAQALQALDQVAVRKAITRSLNWLLPVTVGVVTVLIAGRREIVGLIYERNAFDQNATGLVAAALLGSAPGIVGLTLVEVFHRTMVLRGRLKGYLVVFAGALALTWLGCRVLVPAFGVIGLTLSASLGVLIAGASLVAYASRRLESMDLKPMLLLCGRTAVAAAFAFFVFVGLHGVPRLRATALATMAGVAISGLAATATLLLVLRVLGHRWQVAQGAEP